MLMRTVVLVMAIGVAGCHHEPVIDTGPKPPGVGGTISGNVRSPEIGRAHV